VVLVHHTGKDVSKGLRGHSSLIAAVDGAVEVVRDRVNGSRKWLTGKVKEGADDVEHGFGLHVVVVGQNKRGKDVTSCVVTQEAQVPSAKKLTGGNASAMKSLRIAMGKASIQTPSEVVNHTGRAKAPGWCVPEAIWRETAYDDGIAAEGTTDSAKRKAFDRARGALREKGYIDVACGYAWPIDYGDTPP
jgi:hypothetical protein